MNTRYARRTAGVIAAAGALIAASCQLLAPASAATPSGAAARKVTITAPSGAVIVTLKNQLTNLPDTPGNAAARKAQTTQQQNTVLSTAGIASGPAIKHFTLSNAFAATITKAQAAKLAADPSVATIVPDAKVAVYTDAGTAQQSKPATPKTPKTPAKPSNPKTGAGSNPDELCPANPNKPLLEPEALSLIKADNQTGQPAAQDIATGSGVRVAIFAEAIDPTAPDFIRPNGTSAIVDYQNFAGGPDTAAAGESYGEEIFGDASSIAAQGRVVHDLSQFVNAAHPLPAGCNVQIRGVAPGADIVALKVLGSGTGDGYAIASNMAQAIDYAVSVDHVNVLSESVGAEGVPDAGTANAVQQFNDLAVAAGVTVVASTGDGGTTGTIGSPAADPLVISAAGSTALRSHMQVGYTGTTLSNGKWIDGNIGGFSSGGYTNSGTVPVLTAPGDAGWAACTDKTDLPGCTALATDANGTPLPSSMEWFAGTSEAAPFIAGTAALVIQAYRDSHRGQSPTPAVVRQILTSSADDLGAPASEQGAGQVDALSAVRLARAYKGTAAAANSGADVLLSTDQFTNVATQGTPISNTVTATNVSTKSITLQPQVRALTPIGDPQVINTQVDAGGQPSLAAANGTTVGYTKVTFKVAKNVDQFALNLAYPSAPGSSVLSIYGSVSVALLDPSGAYAGNSRPQGTSNYGNLDIVKPKAGTWTAIIAAGPATVTLFGVPIQLPGYQGPVTLSVTQNRWTSVGTASPASVTIPAGGSHKLTITSRMPGSAGDSSASVTLGTAASVNDTSVSITQRVIINTSTGTGRFTGGVTGGNGRANSPAQTQTYAFTVPAGKQSLNLSLQTSASAAIPQVQTMLIDPNGQVQSGRNNANGTAQTAASRSVFNSVADPIPGQWRLVVRTLSPSSGLDVVVPFTGTITFNKSGVDSADLGALHTGSPVTLAQGTARTMTVQVTNPSGTTQVYYADARTATITQVSLASLSLTMPTPESDLLGANVLVPPGTTQLASTVTAPVAVQAQLTGPTAPDLLGGPNALGAPAQPTGGSASSTATMSTTSGTLEAGHYGVLAGSVGPFGDDGAPAATATAATVATTPGFDTAITSDAGDVFGGGTASGVSIPPGQTAAITLTLNPTAAVGTRVAGQVNIVQGGNDTVTTQLLNPGTQSTYAVVASFPYDYVIGAPAASSSSAPSGSGSSSAPAGSSAPDSAPAGSGTSSAPAAPTSAAPAPAGAASPSGPASSAAPASTGSSGGAGRSR